MVISNTAIDAEKFKSILCYLIIWWLIFIAVAISRKIRSGPEKGGISSEIETTCVGDRFGRFCRTPTQNRKLSVTACHELLIDIIRMSPTLL